LLAPVIERGADLPVDLVTHFSRDADATGFDQCRQPRRDIHVATEEIVTLDDYFAQIVADAT